MNISKYLLPASVAATVHVALFWLSPEPSSIRISEVPLQGHTTPTKPIEAPEDPVEKTELAAAVKPLVGAPAPVSLEEPPAQVVKTVFEMPVEPTRAPVDFSRGPVPPQVGVPGGDREGLSGAASDIWNIASLDHTPRAKVQMPPDYPYAMKQRGVGGSVLVEFDVDRSGRVTRAEAVSFTDREFVEPALRAVRHWRFEPGRKDGRTVPFRMTVPIEFGIEPAI